VSFINIMMNKKAVSLMISYVLLISIAVIISISVFAWLKIIANVEPVIDCKDGTSIIIEDYFCDIGQFNLNLRNNGRFSIDGIIVSVGDNPDREPLTKIAPIDSNRISASGYYRFENELKPGSLMLERFSNEEILDSGQSVIVEFDEIRTIRIQPYIVDDDSLTKVVCSESVIRKELQNCLVK
jgi:hypothetical protein